MVSRSSPMPETETRKADESISSSNKGINMALILTLVLSIVVITWALVAAPHNNSGSNTLPQTNSATTAIDTRSMADGTLGAVINVTGTESKSDASRLHGQKLQSDTISPVGPGGFAKDAQANPQSSKTPRN